MQKLYISLVLLLCLNACTKQVVTPQTSMPTVSTATTATMYNVTWFEALIPGYTYLPSHPGHAFLSDAAIKQIYQSSGGIYSIVRATLHIGTKHYDFSTVGSNSCSVRVIDEKSSGSILLGNGIVKIILNLTGRYYSLDFRNSSTFFPLLPVPNQPKEYIHITLK